MIVITTFAYSLPAAHTLARPNLPQEDIEKYYSVCGKQHGHRYQLEISWKTEPDTRSDLKDRVKEYFNQNLLGKYLNEVFQNTAGEALAKELLARLQGQSWGGKIIRVAIQETDKNRFVAEADSNLRYV